MQYKSPIMDFIKYKNGEDGQNGMTPYIHIKYSNDGGVTFTNNNGETPGDYMGVYADFTEADSSTLSKYKWTKIKGEQGIQGLQGPKGEDGTGVNILGEYDTEEELYSAHPTGNLGDAYLVSGNLYVWAESKWENVGNIQGPQGESGQGVDSITPEYYLSTSKETPTGGEWSKIPPTWKSGTYLWIRNEIIYSCPTNPSKGTATKLGTPSIYIAEPIYTEPYCDSSWEVVNEIQVGGRNLLLGTGTGKDWYYTDFDVNTHTFTNENAIVDVTYILSQIQPLNLDSMQEYTLSFYAKRDNDLRNMSVKLVYADGISDSNKLDTPIIYISDVSDFNKLDASTILIDKTNCLSDINTYERFTYAFITPSIVGENGTAQLQLGLAPYSRNLLPGASTGEGWDGNDFTQMGGSWSFDADSRTFTLNSGCVWVFDRINSPEAIEPTTLNQDYMVSFYAKRDTVSDRTIRVDLYVSFEGVGLSASLYRETLAFTTVGEYEKFQIPLSTHEGSVFWSTVDMFNKLAESRGEDPYTPRGLSIEFSVVPPEDEVVAEALRGVIDTVHFKDIQLEKGTAATEYMPALGDLDLSGQPTVLSVKNIQLELGNKATDWRPAPEDVEQLIDDLDTNTSQRFNETYSFINEVNENSQEYTRTIVRDYAKITDLDETRSSLSSQISAAADSIKMEVSNTYMTITKEEEIYTTITSMIDQSANGITMTFKTDIEDVLNVVDLNKKNRENYIRFEGGVIELGERDSVFKCNLSNTELSFSENGTVVAYISNSAMYITNARITERLILGRQNTGYYSWIVGGDGHMTLTWSAEERSGD